MRSLLSSVSKFAEHYRSLPDGKLLEIAATDDLATEAKKALSAELSDRNLGKQDILLESRRAGQIGQQEVRKYSRQIRAIRDVLLPRTGVEFRGKKYLSEADRAKNIILTTKWVTFRYLPLFPLASYRVVHTGGFWSDLPDCHACRIISKEKLSFTQVLLVWGKYAGAGILVLTLLYLFRILR